MTARDHRIYVYNEIIYNCFAIFWFQEKQAQPQIHEPVVNEIIPVIKSRPVVNISVIKKKKKEAESASVYSKFKTGRKSIPSVAVEWYGFNSFRAPEWDVAIIPHPDSSSKFST